MSDQLEATTEEVGNYVAERVVRDLTGKVAHEVVQTTETGNHVSKCSSLFYAGRSRVTENDLVSCPRCKNPAGPFVVATPIPRPTIRKPRPVVVRKNPRWGRNPKDVIKNVQENLKFTQAAVEAAQEWMARGDPGQFMKNTLDQMKLAYRFLGEVLEEAGMIPRPPVEDLEEE